MMPLVRYLVYQERYPEALIMPWEMFRLMLVFLLLVVGDAREEEREEIWQKNVVLGFAGKELPIARRREAKGKVADPVGRSSEEVMHNT